MPRMWSKYGAEVIAMNMTQLEAVRRLQQEIEVQKDIRQISENLDDWVMVNRTERLIEALKMGIRAMGGATV